MIYADFEAIIVDVDAVSNTRTTKTGRHEVCGYGYIKVRCDGHTEPPVIYRGPEAAYKFLHAMKAEEKRIRNDLELITSMSMTDDDKKRHWDTDDCHICEKPMLNVWQICEEMCGTPTQEPFLGEAHVMM